MALSNVYIVREYPTGSIDSVWRVRQSAEYKAATLNVRKTHSDMSRWLVVKREVE